MVHDISAFPEQVFRRSCGSAVCRNSETDLNLFDMHHRSIHSDPGVRFDFMKHQKLESSVIKNQFLKQLMDASSRGSVARRRQANDARCLNYPSTGLEGLSSGQNRLLQSMYKKYSTKNCLLRNDLEDAPVSLDRHRNSNQLNLLSLDSNFVVRKYFHHGRAISTSLSSSTASLYSEEDVLCHCSRNLSPAPSVSSECPSILFESRKSLSFEIEKEDLSKDLGITEEKSYQNNDQQISSSRNTLLTNSKISENKDENLCEEQSPPESSLSSLALSTVQEDSCNDRDTSQVS